MTCRLRFTGDVVVFTGRIRLREHYQKHHTGNADTVRHTIHAVVHMSHVDEHRHIIRTHMQRHVLACMHADRNTGIRRHTQAYAGIRRHTQAPGCTRIRAFVHLSIHA